MVTVTNYSERNRKDGTTFIALELSGGVELVQSGKNAHIDHPVALQTDHPKLLFFLRV